jgi:ribosomal protein L37AE/L43A
VSRGRPYRCPLCPSKALTRPKAMLHIWAHALANETGMPFAEVEETLKRHHAEGLVRVNTRNGDLIGRWSAMGEFGAKVREAMRRIEEENKREREARRQARRETLEREEAS